MRYANAMLVEVIPFFKCLADPEKILLFTRIAKTSLYTRQHKRSTRDGAYAPRNLSPLEGHFQADVPATATSNFSFYAGSLKMAKVHVTEAAGIDLTDVATA